MTASQYILGAQGLGQGDPDAAWGGSDSTEAFTGTGNPSQEKEKHCRSICERRWQSWEMPTVQCGWAKGGAQRPRDEPREEHGNVYKSWITETLKGCEVEMSPEPSSLIEYSERVR